MNQLWTKEGEVLHHTNKQPWDTYPRPMMRRTKWINLNGCWEFTTSNNEQLPRIYDQTINVPFAPESVLSGIHRHFDEGTYLFYRKQIIFSDYNPKKRTLLHFGAIDQVADVYVNGNHVCHHEGGYDAFYCEISDLITSNFEIVIRCFDNLDDKSFPYGKQTKNRKGMWYTPTSGIWQTVWIEQVPMLYIETLTIENRQNQILIDTNNELLEGCVRVKELGEFSLVKGKVSIEVENPCLWSPESPYLYDFSISCNDDFVESYFAIRHLDIKFFNGYQRLCLNGKPYFFHGVLDQGYWPDGILTPASSHCYVEDIMHMKKLGFNTLRKHIKVEAAQFYYECDRLGMLVWQDMVNNGPYHFIRDTALPNVFMQKRSDKNLHTNVTNQKRFIDCMNRTVNQLRNHPSIVYWTIFNEGWGQFDADKMYKHLKSLDDTRFIDSTSGWFRQNHSDVDSRHIYFRKSLLKASLNKPLVLSEFGGKAYKVDNHVIDPNKSYGYGQCKTIEELSNKIKNLYLNEVMVSIKKGLCASIYTQLSDVEDEINGIITYDRKIVKVDSKVMLQIADALQNAMDE